MSSCRGNCCRFLSAMTLAAFKRAGRPGATEPPVISNAAAPCGTQSTVVAACYDFEFAHACASPSSRGPGRGPFKAKTRVRIPLGTNPPSLREGGSTPTVFGKRRAARCAARAVPNPGCRRFFHCAQSFVTNGRIPQTDSPVLARSLRPQQAFGMRTAASPR